MKVRDLTKPAFQPIVLEVTIESRDELYELWHRLNVGFSLIKDYTPATEEVPHPSEDSTPIANGIFHLWKHLDEKTNELS